MTPMATVISVVAARNRRYARAEPRAALTNITKHAQPERVEVRLAYQPSATRLVVEDFACDGNRPSPAGGDGAGYGLTGMRERAELLGGQLTAGATDNGFRVELEVPA